MEADTIYCGLTTFLRGSEAQSVRMERMHKRLENA